MTRPPIRRDCDLCGHPATHALVYGPDRQEWQLCKPCWSRHNHQLLPDTERNQPTEEPA